MSLRGVWQLQKLVIKYCDWSGSSRGAREFLSSHLADFQARNPQLEVVPTLNRGQHPLLQGFFLNGREKAVGVKNETPDQILQVASRLRNSTGRRVVKLKTRHTTEKPSIQGMWTPQLQKELQY